MSSSRLMNIFFLLSCQGFIAVVGDIRKLSQHSLACLQRLTQQLQAGNSAERTHVLMLLMPKKMTKAKIGGFKNLWGWEGWKLMFVTKANRIKYLPSPCILLRVCSEETFRAWL